MNAQTPIYTSGNLVVVVEGCGVYGGTCTNIPNGTGTGSGNSSNTGYGDNQGAPLTLFQFKPTGVSSATFVNSLVLPQVGSGANLPIAGEYGSSSEGSLQLAGTGQYLTLGSYGINAAVFNAATAASFGDTTTTPALAQTGSLTGQSYTPVARIPTFIDPYGNVNSSTAVFNIFNTNNPRSVYSANGLTAYMSGQGSGSDATGGVFYLPSLGSVNNAPTAITGLDTSTSANGNAVSSSNPGTLSQDTRFVTVFNNTLYVSLDTKGGSGNARSFVGTLGSPPSTSVYVSGTAGSNPAGPTQLTGFGTGKTGQVTLTAAQTNGINASGQQINLSPSNYFFANASTLYVADTGNPKQTSGTSKYGDGGLQKWVNTQTNGSGTWQLMYTLASGLSLVANPNASSPANTSGTTGLYGLTGVINGSNVYLYVTNATIADLDPTYLYGISDPLASTTNPGTSFTLLATAPVDSNFKGVSFAPTLPAGSATILTAPEGLQVTTAGTGCGTAGTYTTPVTLIWTSGSSCQLSVSASQTAGGLTYQFAQWQDATTATTDNVTAPSASAVYTATFTGPSVFVANAGGTDSSFYDSGGAVQTPSTSGGGIGEAVDSGGFVWSITSSGSGVTKFSKAGAVTSSYSPSGLSGASAIAIDGNGTVWFAQGGSSNNIYALSNAGTPVSNTGLSTAAGISTPASISIDTAGSLWIANSGNSTVTEVVGAAAPVVAPTVAQVTNGTQGTKP